MAKIDGLKRPQKQKPAAVAKATPDFSARAWTAAAAAILATSALLCFYDLALKPLHHDEGVNGNFLLRLLREGYYHYDPANYHGPTLYYFALLVVRVTGLSDASVRIITGLFGVATVALVLGMRRLIGKREALAAAALVALSPGAVFYSRYFIHEILFVFFTLVVALCAWQAWQRRDPLYIPVGAIAAAFLFATKETALVSCVVLALAVGTQALWVRLRGFKPDPPPQPRPGLARYALIGAAGFAAVFVLLYSSFFTNAKGIHDALSSLSIWTKTGFSMEFYPKYAYLTWMWREEWPLLVTAIVGGAVALWIRPAGFAAFAAIWAAGQFAVYTLIPYKEPWLALNFTIPAAIAAGSGAVRLWERRRWLWLVGAALAGVLVFETIQLNFVHYDDNDEPYVYMHTTREVKLLMYDIDAAAARLGKGYATDIAILSPEYWPLPWYLRDYTRVGYWGHLVDTSAPIVICSKEQAWDLKDRLGPAYQFVRFYDLRPAVTLALFTRK